MMEQFAGGGMPSMPGMPGGGRGAMGGSATKKAPGSARKGKKKRAARPTPQQAAALEDAVKQVPESMDEFQLPPELQKMFEEQKKQGR